MNPLILLAELLANGITVEHRDGVWHYVGADGSRALGTLGKDLDQHHRELEDYLNQFAGSQNAR